MNQSRISEEKICKFVGLFDRTQSVNSDSGIRLPDWNVDSYLSPWHFWALVCLARHHIRQNWVADIVKFRLRGEPEALAAAGALGHPDIPQSGLVPNDNEWEYYFHGGGCCLTHRGTGESIDVDFFDETGDYFTLWFFKQYLKSLKSPEFPEKRLIELHPSFESLDVTVKELFNSNAFLQHSEKRAYKLVPQIVLVVPSIERFCEQIATRSKALQLAIQSADWLLAFELLSAGEGGGHIRELVKNNANAVVEDRLSTAARMFEDSSQKRDALAAMYDTSSSYADGFIREAIKGNPDGTVSYAIELIARSGDESWCPQVYDLLLSVSPESGVPEPYIWKSCISFLLEHEFKKDSVIEMLDLVVSRVSAEAALLALKHAPSKAIRLFRVALRSTVPLERIESSAMLAIIDQPWSRKELINVILESDDQQMTLYARGALLAGKHPEDHSIVEQWEADHPCAREDGDWITFGEMEIRNCDATIRYEIQKRHEQVWPLRNVKVN